MDNFGFWYDECTKNWSFEKTKPNQDTLESVGVLNRKLKLREYKHKVRVT